MKEEHGNRIYQRPIGSHALHIAALPTLPERIRHLLNAALAAKGGVERMTLRDWREAEHEIKRKLDYECSNTQ